MTTHNETIDSLLSDQAIKYSGHTFLTDDSHSFTYGEVNELASSAAAALVGLGLQPGDRLGILLPNVAEFVISVFAAAKAGLLLVPINLRRNRAEIFTRLAKTAPKALITFSNPALFRSVDHLATLRDLKSDLPELEIIISAQGEAPDVHSWADLLSHKPLTQPASHSSDSAAAIVHTLGSFGQPRGAVLTHSGMVRNATDIAAALECRPEDKILGAVPFSNAFGLTPTILATVAAGAHLICMTKYEPGEAIEIIHSHSITVHHGVPTMFAMELNHSDFASKKFSSVRTGIMAGAPCPPDLILQVREKMIPNLLVAYGLTEASPSVTMTRLDDGPITATQTVGRAMPGVELKLIDTDRREVTAGQEGELCVRGYNVMRGYWEDPEATALVLDKEGWLRTGDLASMDADGPVRILGRTDEVINRGGFKIHPGTVEMVLRSFPGVKEAALVAIPDAIFGEIGCACVVQAEGAEIDVRDLQGFAAQQLPNYAIPDRVQFFDALPRGKTGTINKAYLREHLRVRGTAWTFGRNIDTDAIIPARRCITSDPAELAKYCMEDADPDFIKKMQRGDVIVADTNFGCGSSREVAPISIKAAGVSAVIAKSFARIFFRNSINIGLPILESEAAVEGIEAGDELEVEPAAGRIRNLTRGTEFSAKPYPEFLQSIIEGGGLLPYVEARLAERDS
jgi:fatty-acyl-CoA synthase